MAVNPMQKKARNAFLLGMLIMFLIGGIVAGILIYKLNQLQQEMDIKTARTVYMLSQDVQSGWTITSDMLQPLQVQTAPSNPVTTSSFMDQNGQPLTVKVKTDLKQGTVVTTDMVYDSTDSNYMQEQGTNGEVIDVRRKDTRIQEYNMISLPSKLKKGDYIDIRLTLANAQDYIVLSKKEVLDCDLTTIWIQVSEDEIMTMNNAIIEHYILASSNLYATIYDEAGMQEALVPTYTVSSVVISTMSSTPNILADARNAFNARMQQSSENRQYIESSLQRYVTQLNPREELVQPKVEETREGIEESRATYFSTLDSTY